MDKTVKPLLIVLSLLFLSSGTTYAQPVLDPELESVLQALGEGEPGADQQLRNLWMNRYSLDIVQDLVGAQFTDDAKRRRVANQALNILKVVLIPDEGITNSVAYLLAIGRADERFKGDDRFIDRLRDYVKSILDEKKSKALPVLFDIIRNKALAGRDWAADIAVHEIGGLTDEQLGFLMDILNDRNEPNHTVKFAAAYGLSERGIKRDDYALAAFEELKLGNAYHRALAVYLLEKSSDSTREYVDQLWDILTRDTERYQSALAMHEEQQRNFSIKRANKQDLTYAEEEATSYTQNAIWYMAQVRAGLARILASHRFRPTQITAILVEMMTSKPLTNYWAINFGAAGTERFSVLRGFKGLGADAAKVLLPMYEANPEGQARLNLIVALGYTGESCVMALPSLFVDFRNNQLTYFRPQIIVAIGRIGSAVPEIAIPKLIEIHRSREFSQDIAAGEGLDDLARNLRDTDRGVNFIDLLKEARDELQRNDREEVKKNADTLESVIQILNQRWWQQLFESRFFTYGQYFVPFAALLVVWFLLYLVRPYYLFKINEQLLRLPIEVRLLSNVGGPLRYVLLVGFFHYRRRVLDAWVEKQVDNVRDRFSSRSTVKESKNYVPIPVELDEKKLTSLKPESLKPLFKRPATALMIAGEGGIGKTTLACLIAKWSMAEDDEVRLCEHYILPVMIEQDNEVLVANSPANVIELAIQLQLKTLAQQDELPPAELVRHLLKQKRMMIIVDGFSEFDESVRKKIIADISRLPVSALLFTSRHAEYFEDYAPATIQPMKIGGEFLSHFLGTYLTERKVRKNFDDEEFFNLCRRISLLSNSRLVTALLVKLFADLAVAIKLKALDEDLPQNLPDVFLYYINYLNRDFDKTTIANEKVQSLMKIVAWQCLQNGFHPSLANTTDVLNAFCETDQAAALLEHLEERLNLVRRVGVSRDRIRFVMEPLSEYLASMYWLDLNGRDDHQWNALLSKLATAKQTNVPINGFIQALQDCCATKYAGLVPEFAPIELEKISGIGMEDLLVKSAQKRVKHILHDLDVLDRESLNLIKTRLFTQDLAVEGMSG